MQDLQIGTIAQFITQFCTLPGEQGRKSLQSVTWVDAWGFGQKIHHLKLLQPYFDDVASGRKQFELRKNDRKFEVGHFLCLWEFANGEYNDRAILTSVPYILQGCPQFGLTDGYCCMSIKVFSTRGLEE